MILVNDQGDGAHAFWGMSHAKWNGFSFADLVFPAFLVIVGASMAYSFAAARARGATRADLLHKAARRAAVLVAIGLAMHALPRPDLDELRLPGVLQRIGVASLLAAGVVLYLRPRRQAAVAVGILVVYGAALMALPVPGVGHPLLTPDASLPGWLDQHVFGARHVYGNGGYDPEGLLGTLSAVVSVLIGFWAGELMRRSPWRRTVRRLAIGGAALVGAGIAANAVVPVNKRLWTPSFVLLTAGLSLLLLGACHLLVDVRGAPRLVRAMEPLGRNAILVYVASEEAAHVLKGVHVGAATLRELAYGSLFRPLLGFDFGSLGYALAVAGAFWLVAEAMHRRGAYVKI